MNKILTFAYFANRFQFSNISEFRLKNDMLHSLIDSLTISVKPSKKTKLDTFWEDFYIPLKKGKNIILFPLAVSRYKDEYFCFMNKYGRISISKGNGHNDDDIYTLLRSTLNFTNSKPYNLRFVEKKVPYYFRTGKIQGKYVLEETMSRKEKQRISKKYNSHQAKKFVSEGCSLQEYLNVCAICYKAAFGKHTNGMTPLKMYQTWADKRDGGMLSIKDAGSRQEFLNWYNSDQWSGSHPFEIIYSMMEIGICLFPPNSSEHWFSLRESESIGLSLYTYLKMVDALIEHNIAFKVPGLGKTLKFLSGQTYFTVNNYSEHEISYSGDKEDREKYLPHIKWDKLKILRKR